MKNAITTTFRTLFTAAVISCLLTAARPAPAAADQVFLQNGSIINGRIKTFSGDTLEVETNFAGTLQIKADKIKGLATDMPMTARMDNGDTFVAQLAYDDDDGQRLSNSSLGTIKLAASEIKAVWPKNQPDPEAPAAARTADDVWSAKATLGLSASEGNTDKTNLNGKFTTTRKTDFDRLNLGVQGRYATDEGEETENEIIATGKLERDFSDHLFAFGSLKLERDKFEDLDLRSNLTVGLGYFVIKEEGHEFKPRLGFGYEVSAFQSSPNEESFVLSAGWDYKRDLWKDLTFTHAFTYLPVLEEPTDEYRLESEAIVSYPFAGGTGWNLDFSIRHQYDNSPAANVDRLDTYYSLGLTREFK